MGFKQWFEKIVSPHKLKLNVFINNTNELNQSSNKSDRFCGKKSWLQEIRKKPTLTSHFSNNCNSLKSQLPNISSKVTTPTISACEIDVVTRQ